MTGMTFYDLFDNAVAKVRQCYKMKNRSDRRNGFYQEELFISFENRLHPVRFQSDPYVYCGFCYNRNKYINQ